jgi:nucleoside-diphosphate-sugar epimerase
MRILVTGGCGFLGAHVVDHFLKNTRADIVVLDKLTYSSNGYDRLRDSEAFDSTRVTVLAADFRQELPPGVRQEIGAADYIIHLGGSGCSTSPARCRA